LEWRKERNVYEIVWFERGRRRRQSTSSKDIGRAQDFLQSFFASRPADNRPSHPDKRYIADVMALYLEEKRSEMTPNTLRTLQGVLKPLNAWWGDKEASVVNERTCKLYVKSRKTKTTACPRRELAYLKAALNHDWKAGRLLQKIPVWLPRPNKPKDRFLTRSEAARLLWAARSMTFSRDYLVPFILIALYTGGRKTAILSMKWPQVNFARGIINLDCGGVMTTKRHATIPIPRRLLTFLRYARKRGTDLGYVISIHQAPIKDIKSSFRAACKRAGLEKVTPHTLRHTAASWMVQAGVPLFDVARYLGHTSTAMVESTYGHMAPGHLHKAAAALDYRKKQ
jgi:integrase